MLFQCSSWTAVGELGAKYRLQIHNINDPFLDTKSENNNMACRQIDVRTFFSGFIPSCVKRRLIEA